MMKTREILLPIVTLALGLGLGLGIGRSREDPPAPAGEGSVKKGPGTAGTVASHVRSADSGPGPENAVATSRTKRERPADPARENKSAEPRVSIPLKTVANLLKDDLSYSDFMVLGRKMDQALTMLGASEQEKADVIAAIDRNEAVLLAEEKANVKVASMEDSKVTLDLSGMEEPAKRIATQLEEEIRAALPNDLAEALIGSMDLKRYYFMGEARETSFRITRSDSGGLMATQATGGGSTGSGIQPQKFPDDGTPIPAAEVFDKRWSTWLEGVMLQPSPKP